MNDNCGMQDYRSSFPDGGVFLRPPFLFCFNCCACMMQYRMMYVTAIIMPMARNTARMPRMDMFNAFNMFSLSNGVKF